MEGVSRQRAGIWHPSPLQDRAGYRSPGSCVASSHGILSARIGTHPPRRTATSTSATALTMLFDLLPSLLLLPLEEGAEPTADAPSMLPVFLAIAAIFWFVMIAPERKNRKKREELLSGLKKGDKIMMKSGLYGSVAQVKEDVITVQVADGVRLKFAREAIQGFVDEEERAEAAKKDAESSKEEPSEPATAAD